jgi:fimbrial isopeptide formation D2 family protein
VVTFALTIYNTGGDDAYDINVTDTLPTGFVTPTDISDLNLRVYQGSSDVEIDSTLYEASLVDTSLDGTADTLTVNFEDVVLTGDIDRDSGDGTDVFIVTYQLTVDNETAADTDIVTAGSTHTNTATVDFFTGVDDSDIDRTEVLGEPTDDAAVTIAEPTVDKTLISTEIVDTTNSNTEAVIGELVTYQVEVTLPEGLTENAVLKDTLDSGLTFNELLSVTSTSTDLSTSIGDSSFTATNSTNFTATTNGNLLTIDLGDITNSNDNNTAAETVTIVYTAYVNNDSANQSTTTLNNSAQLTFTGGDGESNTDSADDVTVIEPELEVDKSVVVNGVDDNSSGDAGDTVVYTITIQHTTDSETTAYDVDFSDQIPDEIQIDTSTAWLTVDDQGTGGGAVTADDFTLDGNLLTLNDTIDMLEDRVITLTVTGTLVADVAPDEIITNEAEVTWQSLDGDDDNERTGDDGPGGLNDYSDSDDADVTIAAPTVEKTLVSTGIIDGTNLIDEAVIGELVTYQVVVTLPEGVTEGAVLKDTLPDGLTFNALLSVTPSSDLSSSLNFTDLANFTASISENTLSIDLGNITNTNADDSVDDTVTIVYTAYVNNDVDSLNGEALNESTDTLSNSAQLTYTRGDTGEEGASDIDSAETVTVIEPELEVSKDVEVNGVAGNTSGDAGDTVVYTIVIQHSDDSETTAYDVDFSDQIPDEIQIDTSTAWLTVDDQGTGGGAVTADDFTLDGNLLTLNDTIDMLEDRVITLTVTGTLVADVVPDEIITNEAEITWQSLDGDNDNERTGDGEVNDYSASDDADIDIFDVGITKTLIDTGISEDGGASDNVNDQDTLNERLEATIGETVTYEVVLTIPEGELSSAQLVDVLDEGLQFDQIVSTTFSSGLVRTDPVTSSTSGQEITFDFGTITNTNDDNTADETITIRYTAIVLDDAVNVNGRSDVDNAAHLVWNTDSGTDSSVTVDAEDLTIIEPQITTTKSVVDKDAGGLILKQMNLMI